MGACDTFTKDYTRDCKVFADAFNLHIYKGEQVIKPEKLHPLDTTEISVPFDAEGAEIPVQKQRDGLKYVTAMEDDKAIYLLMAIESQMKVHYAMPVRDMLYDALQYATQVERIAKVHQEARAKKLEKQKHDPAEFLSGFYREDRLIPVVTLVMYFSPDEWDGPKSLHDMLSVQDPMILSLVSDYKLNLFEPANISKEELERLTSSLREVMLFIKYAKDKDRLNELLDKDERFRNVERKAARVIEAATGAKFKMQENKEDVDMCQALREMVEDANKEGVQQGIAQEKRLIACRMLQNRQNTIAYIAEKTGLSEEQVRVLKLELEV